MRSLLHGPLVALALLVGLFGPAGAQAPPALPLDRLDGAQINPKIAVPDRPKELVALVGTPKSTHFGQVHNTLYGAGGKMLATSGLNGYPGAYIWGPSGELLGTVAGPGRLFRLDFSPTSPVLAAAGDKVVLLWDLRTLAGRQKPVTLPASPSCPIISVRFSPDGKILASSSRDTSIKLWKMDGLKATHHLSLPDHADQVNDVAFTRDGKRLASASNDGIVFLWDLTKSPPARLASWKADTKHGTNRLLFTRDGKVLVTCGDDGNVRVWDVSGPKVRERAVLAGHKGEVNGLALAPDDKVLASVGQDGSLRLWDLSSDPPRNAQVVPVSKDWARGVDISPDGKTLITGGSDGLVRAWDLDGASVRPRGPLLANPARPAVTFSPSNRTLALERPGSATLWDLDGPAPRYRGAVNTSGVGTPLGALATLTGAWEADERKARAWRRAEAKIVEALEFGAPTFARGPGGTSLALVTREGLTLFDLGGEVEKASFLGKPARPIRSLAFTADGKSLFVGDVTGAVRRWTLGEGPSVSVVLKAAGSATDALAATADGKSLVVGGRDGRVVVWGLGDEPAKGYEWKAPAPVTSLAWAADGRHLIVATQQEVAYVLRLPAAAKE